MNPPIGCAHCQTEIDSEQPMLQIDQQSFCLAHFDMALLNLNLPTNKNDLASSESDGDLLKLLLEKKGLNSIWLRGGWKITTNFEMSERLATSFCLSKIEFEQHVFFTDCVFDQAVDIKSCHFKGSVVFSRCIFQSSLMVEKCHIDGHAFFIDCKFEDDCHFSESVFCDIVSFEDSEFNRYVSYRDVQFLENAVFKSVVFGGYVNFHNAAFHGFANFRESNFNRVTSFDLVNFAKDVQLDNAEFNHAPTFHSCEFNGTLSLDGSKFHDIDSADSYSSYRELRLFFDQKKQRIEEARMFCLEQRSLRRKSSPLLERGFALIYDWLSGYGTNIRRALLSLLLMNIVVYFGYLSCLDHSVMGKGAFGFAVEHHLRQLFTPFQIWKQADIDQSEFVVKIVVLKVVSSLHSIATAMLLGFLVLALRWRFKRG